MELAKLLETKAELQKELHELRNARQAYPVHDSARKFLYQRQRPHNQNEPLFSSRNGWAGPNVVVSEGFETLAALAVVGCLCVWVTYFIVALVIVSLHTWSSPGCGLTDMLGICETFLLPVFFLLYTALYCCKGCSQLTLRQARVVVSVVQLTLLSDLIAIFVSWGKEQHCSQLPLFRLNAAFAPLILATLCVLMCMTREENSLFTSPKDIRSEACVVKIRQTHRELSHWLNEVHKQQTKNVYKLLIVTQGKHLPAELQHVFCTLEISPPSFCLPPSSYSLAMCGNTISSCSSRSLSRSTASSASLLVKRMLTPSPPADAASSSSSSSSSSSCSTTSSSSSSESVSTSSSRISFSLSPPSNCFSPHSSTPDPKFLVLRQLLPSEIASIIAMYAMCPPGIQPIFLQPVLSRRRGRKTQVSKSAKECCFEVAVQSALIRGTRLKKWSHCFEEVAVAVTVDVSDQLDCSDLQLFFNEIFRHALSNSQHRLGIVVFYGFYGPQNRDLMLARMKAFSRSLRPIDPYLELLFFGLVSVSCEYPIFPPEEESSSHEEQKTLELNEVKVESRYFVGNGQDLLMAVRDRLARGETV